MTVLLQRTKSGGDRLGPLFPDARARGQLLEQAGALVAEGHRLESAGGRLRAALRPLLRVMNAHHASRIEGQPIQPIDIERALAHQFDDNPERAHDQQLALTHIRAEAALESALPTKRVGLYAPEFVQCIHAELHRALVGPEPLADTEPPAAPGAWREATLEGLVAHDLPEPEDIPELLELWQAGYSKPSGLDQAVVGAACSQQLLLRVRPFAHGNGRTARLHTHLVLTAFGLTHGLWSPLRGVARDRDRYFAELGLAPPERTDPLADASLPSRAELEAFASWWIDMCTGEARFMRELLEPEGLKSRLNDLLLWLTAHPWVIGSEKSVVKREALEALHYTALSGPVERSRFLAMLGLQHRTARRVLTSLIDFGVLSAESSRSSVSFDVPLASLRFLFPRLWPEAEVAQQPSSAPVYAEPTESRLALE